MQLHHQKHHATYVNNLNIAEEKFAEAHAKGAVNFRFIGVLEGASQWFVCSGQTVEPGSKFKKNSSWTCMLPA